MSVVLGEIPSGAYDVPELVVSASHYSSDILWLEQGDSGVDLTRKQCQELSKIIDRFLDN